MKRKYSEIAYLHGFGGGGEYDLRRRAPSKVPFQIGPENQEIALALKRPLSYEEAFRRLIGQAGGYEVPLDQRTLEWLLGLREDVHAVQVQMEREFGKFDYESLLRHVQMIVQRELLGRYPDGLRVLPKMALAVCATPQDLRRILAWDK